jgi:hypothetical protein
LQGFVVIFRVMARETVLAELPASYFLI